MANKSGMTIDFKDHDKKFYKTVKSTIPGLAKDGLRKAGDKWILDANEIPPKTPFKDGALRGSGQVDKVDVTLGSIVLVLSFGKGKSGQDAPYAARWHEVEPGTINFKASGAGPKYLESKGTRYKNKYVMIVSETIRRKSR